MPIDYARAISKGLQQFQEDRERMAAAREKKRQSDMKISRDYEESLLRIEKLQQEIQKNKEGAAARRAENMKREVQANLEYMAGVAKMGGFTPEVNKLIQDTVYWNAKADKAQAEGEYEKYKQAKSEAKLAAKIANKEISLLRENRSTSDIIRSQEESKARINGLDAALAPDERRMKFLDSSLDAIRARANALRDKLEAEGESEESLREKLAKKEGTFGFGGESDEEYQLRTKDARQKLKELAELDEQVNQLNVDKGLLGVDVASKLLSRDFESQSVHSSMLDIAGIEDQTNIGLFEFKPTTHLSDILEKNTQSYMEYAGKPSELVAKRDAEALQKKKEQALQRKLGEKLTIPKSATQGVDRLMGRSMRTIPRMDFANGVASPPDEIESARQRLAR